jgi:hypothetical protein
MKVGLQDGLSTWLGWGSKKLIQNFEEENSWKKAIWNTEKKGHFVTIGRLMVLETEECPPTGLEITGVELSGSDTSQC